MVGLWRFRVLLPACLQRSWLDRRPGFRPSSAWASECPRCRPDSLLRFRRRHPRQPTDCLAPMKIGATAPAKRSARRAERQKTVRYGLKLDAASELATAVGHELLRAIAIRQRLSDDADVIDAGLPQRVDHRSKNAEGNRFIAAQENRVLLFAELGLALSRPAREY